MVALQAKKIYMPIIIGIYSDNEHYYRETGEKAVFD